MASASKTPLEMLGPGPPTRKQKRPPTGTAKAFLSPLPKPSLLELGGRELVPIPSTSMRSPASMSIAPGPAPFKAPASLLEYASPASLWSLSPIDREELLPPDASRRIDLTREQLRSRATALAKERKAAKRSTRKHVKGIRKTFTTPSRPPPISSTMRTASFSTPPPTVTPATSSGTGSTASKSASIENRSSGAVRGPITSASTKPPAGKKLIDTLYRTPQTGLVGVLAWLFGKTRSRRWNDVDWDAIRSLGEALQPAADAYRTQFPEEAHGAGGITWYPITSGQRSPAELLGTDALSPDQAEQLAELHNVEQLLEHLADLESAYLEARSCLSREAKVAIRRRILQLRKLADAPQTIPGVSLCAAGLTREGDTSGTPNVCGWPAVREEIRRVKQACQQSYDPDWPKGRVRELADCAEHRCTGRDQDRAGALLEAFPSAVLAPEEDARALPSLLASALAPDHDEPDDEIPF